MSEYPTLADMGISRFDEIRDYSFFSENNNDVLKIYYKRKEGSLLPRRKVFKFPKHIRPVPGAHNQAGAHEIREPSPTLLKAIDEIQSILKASSDVVDHKEQILRRLEQLESEVQTNVAEIRSLLERI